MYVAELTPICWIVRNPTGDPICSCTYEEDAKAIAAAMNAVN